MTIVNNIVYLKVAKRINLNSSHHEKSNLKLYTDIRSLCFIPWSNIILYANYMSIKLERKKKDIKNNACPEYHHYVTNHY